MKKQIAGALMASLLIGAVPARAEDETATTKPRAEAGAQGQPLRESIDRAVEGAPTQGTPAAVPKEPGPSGPQLTAHERRDLDARREALRTDPVARGAGGIVLLLLGTAVTIGVTAYVLNKTKNESTPTPTPTPAMASR